MLARAISEGQLAGAKAAPRIDYGRLVELGGSGSGDHWAVLTGCRKGAVPAALAQQGPAEARRRLDRLAGDFGRSNVFVELWDHGLPLDSLRNDGLAEIAVGAGVGIVATGNVHHHSVARHRLASALAAVRARRSLDEIDGWLPPAGRHLRSGAEQARRFARYPGVVERAAELGLECAFDLSLIAPDLPPYPCPDGLDEMGFLRRLVESGGVGRYGPRGRERVAGAWDQLDFELDQISEMGFAGYFLVVWDIVEFCRRNDIYCQGRGSAANSAVCFVLGITNADAVSLGLLFERFLSPERDGPPDIDIDIESQRREEVIGYVYERYGRHNCAQVANVITYRSRSAIRDMAKALGYSTGRQDSFARAAGGFRFDPGHRRGPTEKPRRETGRQAAARHEPRPTQGRADPPGRGQGRGGAADRGAAQGAADRGAAQGAASGRPQARRQPALDGDPLPAAVAELAAEIEHFPRHLGIHSGGMVMCDRPVIEVCPVEWAAKAGRSVLQWDKQDCAEAGIVKFDLLGLGALSMLHHAVDLIGEHHGVTVDLAALPQQDEVYEMLCRADAVGVFQVESRAQMATLPRLKPRCFYDLVVEVALIRPGPIQGGSVHPYIRRRNGLEPVTFLHPLLEKSLAKTLGVPLFQEQLMQMAVDVAGFSAGEADQLRQALGAKRSRQRMARLRQRFFAGMAAKGIDDELGEQIWAKVSSFADYGFPESHAASFAYLVYASAWIKLRYPAAFCAALLRAQPMGFWSPHTLVGDARRHGVEVRTVDINASDATAGLEPSAALSESAAASGSDSGKVAVRLGLDYVRGIGAEAAAAIAAGRPYRSVEDLRRRVPQLSLSVLETLATAGAFACFGIDRRSALWTAGAVAQTSQDRLPGIVTGTDAPSMASMTDAETAAADLWATGVAPDGHPTRFVRPELTQRGVVSAEALASEHPGSKVLVGGVVTHRQRPYSAGGTTFLGLEDETGLINVIVSEGCWLRYRQVAEQAAAMIVRGRIEKAQGALNVVAERIEPLPLGLAPASRDFR